jgi:hypothetical protein
MEGILEADRGRGSHSLMSPSHAIIFPIKGDFWGGHETVSIAQGDQTNFFRKIKFLTLVVVFLL